MVAIAAGVWALLAVMGAGAGSTPAAMLRLAGGRARCALSRSVGTSVRAGRKGASNGRKRACAWPANASTCAPPGVFTSLTLAATTLLVAEAAVSARVATLPPGLALSETGERRDERAWSTLRREGSVVAVRPLSPGSLRLRVEFSRARRPAIHRVAGWVGTSSRSR